MEDSATSTVLEDSSSSIHTKRRKPYVCTDSEVTESDEQIRTVFNPDDDSDTIDPKYAQVLKKLMVSEESCSKSSESFEEAVMLVQRIKPTRIRSIKPPTPTQLMETEKSDDFPFNAQDIKSTYKKQTLDNIKRRQMLHEIKIKKVIEKLKTNIDTILINEIRIIKRVKEKKTYLKVQEVDMKKLRRDDIRKILTELQDHRGFQVYGYDTVGLLNSKYKFYISWDNKSKCKSMLGYRVLNINKK